MLCASISSSLVYMAKFLYDPRRKRGRIESASLWVGRVLPSLPSAVGARMEGSPGWVSEACRPLLIIFLFMLAYSPFSLQPALSESLIWKLNHISELTALHL